MLTVQLPSRNSAIVSLKASPQRRWMAMDKAVPKGRAMKAREKMAKAISVPSSRDRKGNSSDGNTRTQAMPNTKKSKYSEDRPMITPTATSPGVMSSCAEPAGAP